jgi:hypothetical protein
VEQSGFYLLPCVVRTYDPVGRTPVLLRERLSRDHREVISGISLEGKLYMMEQQRAFKGEDVVRFLKHLLGRIAGKPLVVSGTAHRNTAAGRSRSSSPAELPIDCGSSSFPATTLRSSTLTKECGSI